MAFLVGLLRAGLCVEFYPQKVGIAGLSNYDQNLESFFTLGGFASASSIMIEDASRRC